MAVKVRIKETPKEHELDGITVDRYVPGSVRDVPTTIGAWLIAEGYAEPEMRRSPKEDLDCTEKVKPVRAAAHDRHPRRRSTDR